MTEKPPKEYYAAEFQKWLKRQAVDGAKILFLISGLACAAAFLWALTVMVSAPFR
jgi:hypothetical protein